MEAVFLKNFLNMQIISKELAAEEVNSWLEYKKVGEAKREQHKDSIKLITDSIVEGYLSLNDDKSLTHVLKFPFGEDVKTTEFKYKARLSGLEVEKAQKGVKEGFAMLMAFAGALTDKGPGLLKHMDTEDIAISNAISVFFI